MADHRVLSELSGSVWKILKQPGEAVAEEEPILILESMKMEIPVVAPVAGRLLRLAVAEGAPVTEGDEVAVIAT
jgi:biotin carboxyl carrier protein